MHCWSSTVEESVCVRSRIGYGVSARAADQPIDVLISEAAVPDDAAVLNDGGRHARDPRLLPKRLDVALEERNGEAALCVGGGPRAAARHQRDKSDLQGTHGTLKSYIG